METPIYSVVVPVYNSAGTLEVLLERISVTMAKLGGSFEIILVNDASTDNSWEILVKLKESGRYPIVIINLSKNVGQHKTTLCGLTQARGVLTITIDDDLQTPPEEIPKLIAHQKQSGALVVYGLPGRKRHSRIRKSGSNLLRWVLMNYATYKGVGSSFRLLHREVLEKVALARFEFVFLEEIISWNTDRIAAVEVDHFQRKDGSSTYSTMKLVKMTIHILLNYTALPLRIITYSGLIIAFIFFGIGSLYLWRWMIWDVPLGFTSLIVAITFSTGILLFSLGIIGEYLRRMYFLQVFKPPYVIKEMIE